MTEAENALLQRLTSGEELTDEEALTVLGLDIEQDVMDTFDQEMLADFLSPDMTKEADLSHQDAFRKLRSDFLSSKSEYNDAVQSVYRDIKLQAKALKSSITPETSEPVQTSINETLTLAQTNRDKLKGGTIGSTAELETALDGAGDVANVSARDTVRTELFRLLGFISNDPLVKLVRCYPCISVGSSIKSCRVALEKMRIQIALLSMEATA
ncbi:MAG: hypothetical protein ACI8RZ_005158 [Myxococcota bacterium]|jgi:hypothetical protein